MRRNDVINGYRVLRDPETVGGGQCRWTFVERGGREYFMKQYLSPKYPVASSPGSAETKRLQLERCEAFERHHREIMTALSGIASRKREGGNLVVAADWFLEGTTYYKITEKIDVTSLTPADIAVRPLADRLLLLITVSHSLQILHAKNIVHGDLKPENILIKTAEAGTLTSKVIDFDNAYFSGAPPLNQAELVGTMSHYSPEVLGYIKGVRLAEELTLASDVFSLGLVFCQYLAGHLPVSSEVGLACDAAVDESLVLPEVIELDGLRRLLENMLHPKPEHRPTITEVYQALRALRTGGRYTDSERRRAPASMLRGVDRFGSRPAVAEPDALGADPTSSAADGERPTVVLRGLEKFGRRGDPEPSDASLTHPDTVADPHTVIRGLEKFRKSDPS